MVRLNRRRGYAPRGVGLLSHNPLYRPGVGGVAGWNTKYQFMLNETARGSLRRAARLGTLLGPEETPLFGVVLWLLPAWTV